MKYNINPHQIITFSVQKFKKKDFENIVNEGEITGTTLLHFPNKFSILKGGYLDFSHLIELEKTYITEIYMKKQYSSSITKNHKIKQKYFFDGVPLKGYVASEVNFRFCARNKKRALWENQVTNDT